MRARIAPGRTRTSTAAAWIGCAVTAALALGRVVLAIIEPTVPPGASAGGDGPAVVVLEALMLTSFAVLGAIVASRQPHNPIGWLLGLIPLSFGLLFVGDSLYWNLAARPGDTPAVGAYAAWLADWIWIGAIVPAFTLIPLLFPTGRPLSHRWRPIAWIAIAAGTATAAGTAFAPGALEQYPAVPNPFGIDSAVVEALAAVGGACLVPVAVASVASLVVRYRRSTGVERQQITWVAAASVLLVLSFIGASVGGDAAFVLLLLGLLFVACAVAVAMLRYRLYDIDVVINRTLVYGALTGLLAAAYLGSVLLLQLVLSPSLGPGRRCIHARGGRTRATRPGAHPSARRPPLLPQQIRRTGHPRGVHLPLARPGGARRTRRRPARRRRRDDATRARLTVATPAVSA